MENTWSKYKGLLHEQNSRLFDQINLGKRQKAKKQKTTNSRNSIENFIRMAAIHTRLDGYNAHVN